MTDDRQTMKDVSHTNPFTGETTGRLFTRGPTVAADGGEEDAAAPDADEWMGADRRTDRTESQTMRDVSHTPPRRAANANRAFERGGREQGVGDE